MTAPRFQVRASDHVASQVRELLRAVAHTDRATEVAAAYGQLMKALQLVPLDFGEGRGEFPSLNLIQRFGIIRPLAVLYSVNMDLHVVWIQAMRLIRP